MAVRVPPGELEWVFDRLSRTYGPQHWWPTTSADNPRFEILIGAVLTQHTAWANVDKAIAKLSAAGPLTPRAVLAHGDRLPDLIRPAGPQNVKAERLRALCRWFIEVGGFDALDEWPTDQLREALQLRRGIGAETADAILVYAFARPRFIADAYAFRLFERLGWVDGRRHYETLRTAVETASPASMDADDYNEFHAQIVAHAKYRCYKRRPECSPCPLRDHCGFGVS